MGGKLSQIDVSSITLLWLACDNASYVSLAARAELGRRALPLLHPTYARAATPFPSAPPNYKGYVLTHVCPEHFHVCVFDGLFHPAINALASDRI
jgi:hypothetical protein